MFKIKLITMPIILLLALIMTHTAFASTKVVISGNLINEAKQAITQVLVSINGAKTYSDKKGHFQLSVKPATIYLSKFSKSAYYGEVQSFSDFELNLTAHNQATIAPITLVHKAKYRVMLAFGGDVMMGRRFSKPYFGDDILIHDDSRLADSKALLKYIKPYMSIADFASVNMETQIIGHKPGARAPKSVTFYSHPETLAALKWAGIDFVNLGNNHMYDYLQVGMKSTLNLLQKSGLGFSGAGLTQKPALSAYHKRVKNTDLALLGFVGWHGNFSPNQTAGSHKGGAAFGSLPNILSAIDKEKHDRKVIITQYHGGLEYSDHPTGVVEQRLKAALDQGAALAIAHHPHVTQGLELYHHKLIAYSMGNFVFDQYFSESPLSFILYVWLDHGIFHRAEIVPIYLKGYQPTPATGMQRTTLLKRLSVLSAQRNTTISRSGSHGVIVASKVISNTVENKFLIHFKKGEKSTNLYQLPWQKQLSSIDLPAKNLSYRLGVNFVNGGDFESFATFSNVERGLFFNRNNTHLNDFGASGKHSLSISLKANQPSLFGMQSFRRVYKPSSVMTVKARFKTAQKVKVHFYWQGRKKRQKFSDARHNGIKHPIATVTVMPKDSWQPIEVDFKSPRIGYRSFRVIAEFELIKAADATKISTGKLNIDDFAVIEWQSAFSDSPTVFYVNRGAKQATYLGLNKSTTQTVIVGVN